MASSRLIEQNYQDKRNVELTSSIIQLLLWVIYFISLMIIVPAKISFDKDSSSLGSAILIICILSFIAVLVLGMLCTYFNSSSFISFLLLISGYVTFTGTIIFSMICFNPVALIPIFPEKYMVLYALIIGLPFLFLACCFLLFSFSALKEKIDLMNNPMAVTIIWLLATLTPLICLLIHNNKGIKDHPYFFAECLVVILLSSLLNSVWISTFKISMKFK